MPRRKSPRDARCEHKRHVKCAPTSKATPHKWERARCKHCHRSFHSSNGLRVHVSTQHPSEYHRSPNSVKAHRSPLKRTSSHGKTEGKREPSKDARRSSSHAGKRGAPLEAQRSRKPNGKQSEVSPVKTPSVAKLEAMIQKSGTARLGGGTASTATAERHPQSQEIACGRTGAQEICFHTTGQLSLPGNVGPSAAVAQAIWWVCASAGKGVMLQGGSQFFDHDLVGFGALPFFWRRTVLKLPAVVYRASEFVWA